MTSLDQRQQAALEIAEIIAKSGYEVFYVGGCVRDELLGLSVKDYDLVTDARPEAIAALFDDHRFVGQKFGISLVVRNGIPFDVATYRKEGVYTDFRRPDHIAFGRREEDARRRDFTINALYRDPFTGKIHDPFGGAEDLRRGLLRCIGDPAIRFREDALRLLRAIRFAARFGLQIEEMTWKALCDLAPLIEHISEERHRDELTRMFLDPNARRALDLLDRSGLLEILLPEIAAMHNVEQGADYHPEGDVYTHTGLVLQYVEPRTPITVWGALLHDVGKPPTFEKSVETGRITFYRHAAIGAEMAAEILKRLKFSHDDQVAISSVVARHMDFMNAEKMRASTLRRFLSAPTIEEDLAVHRADCLGCHGILSAWEFCRAKLADFANRQEDVLPKCFLNGHDLIAMGMQPGPQMGALLREIQDLQADGVITSREEAESVVRQRLQIP